MGGLRQGMAQVFLVEGLDGGIFMGEADGALLVQGVQTLPSLGGVVLPRRGWADRRRRNIRRDRP